MVQSSKLIYFFHIMPRNNSALRIENGRTRLRTKGQGAIAGSRRFRDQVLPGEVERRFSTLVEALRTEVRTRHYSYRTETTYLDWVRRYIAFHDYADPEGVDATAAVRTYLESYLAPLLYHPSP